MTTNWKYFVLLGGMRTGSNLFEQTIKLSADVETFGELFNPNFVGYPKFTRENSSDFDRRDADPITFLADKVRSQQDKLTGFRFFSGHDHRIFNHVLSDENCAKLVLRRNALDTFLSKKIAKSTDQWRVADWAKRRTDRISFDAEEFEKFRLEQELYYHSIFDGLRRSGQTALVLNYEDLLDPETWVGVFRYLCLNERAPQVQSRIVRQNPEPPEEKVSNPEALIPYMDMLEHWPQRNLSSKGSRPSVVLDVSKGLAWDDSNEFFRNTIEKDCASADQFSRPSDLNVLKAWQKRFPDHSAVFYAEHPFIRAYRAFDDFVLVGRTRAGRRVARNLVQLYDLQDLGAFKGQGAADTNAYAEAFTVFLRYLKDHLALRTKAQPGVEWDFQHSNLLNLQRVIPRVRIELQALDEGSVLPRYQGTIPLSQITKPELIELALDAYAEDTIRFGFG